MKKAGAGLIVDRPFDVSDWADARPLARASDVDPDELARAREELAAKRGNAGVGDNGVTDSSKTGDVAVGAGLVGTLQLVVEAAATAMLEELRGRLAEIERSVAEIRQQTGQRIAGPTGSSDQPEKLIVWWHGGGWTVRRADGHGPTFPRRTLAEEKARGLAQRLEGELVVLKKDGTVLYRQTFGRAAELTAAERKEISPKAPSRAKTAARALGKGPTKSRVKSAKARPAANRKKRAAKAS